MKGGGCNLSNSFDNIIKILESIQQAGSSATVVPNLKKFVSGDTARSEYLPKNISYLSPERHRFLQITEQKLKRLHPLTAHSILSRVNGIFERFRFLTSLKCFFTKFVSTIR